MTILAKLARLLHEGPVLRWGRANEWMLRQFRNNILDAVRRESGRAMNGFLLGICWDIPGYDVASCVGDLANLGPESVSACGEAAARYRYDSLAPSGIGIVFGLHNSQILGLLAQIMGDLDQAMVHFEDALDFCRRAGYRPVLAWTCCDYADALLQRNEPGDRYSFQ